MKDRLLKGLEETDESRNKDFYYRFLWRINTPRTNSTISSYESLVSSAFQVLESLLQAASSILQETLSLNGLYPLCFDLLYVRL